MATFTPFMQGTSAQSIINNYLNSGGFNQTIANDSIRNPIFDLRTEQEKAGELKSTDLYPNSLIDFSVPDVPVDPCPEGYQLIDGVCQPMEEFGQSLYQPDNQGNNNNNEEVLTFSEQEYNKMKKDPNNPYGAGVELDKWEVDEDEFGNTVYKYKDKGFTPTLFGIFDHMTGGNKRRKAKFNEAVNTILGQTMATNFFGQNNNPLAFGFQDGDTFTKYSPQNYLNQVGDVVIPGSNQGATMNELLATVGQGTQGTGDGYVAPTQQVNSGQQGTQVSNNLGSLLTDAGERDDTAYQAAIAQNIAQNLAGQGSPHGTASTGSGFSTSLGGFYKGR